jgi:hypothetical protein
MRIIGSALLEIVSGKTAELFGVFVPPWTCRVSPSVLGRETVVFQVTVPVQVNRMVSPSAAEEIALLTVEAEQSLGPTVITAASV